MRRIAVITGSRAEYHLLGRVVRRLAEDERTEPLLVVTGGHLSAAQGLTVEEVRADGVPIAAEVPLPDDTAAAIAAAVSGVAGALEDLRPDLVLVLGDRFEITAAALAATVTLVPIAHVHGGETTEGAFDEAFRHAITKMSHLHFTATEAYRQRVLRLGEQPDRVWNVGALGVDAVAELDPLGDDELRERLGGLDPDRVLLVTYHPTTLESELDEAALGALTGALEDAPGTIVITGANADPGGRGITAALQRWAADRPERALFAQSLGQRAYLSLMTRAAAVIGNSSSGIIEAPAAGVPTVNIGSRQDGRVRAGTVLDVPPEPAAVAAALQRALAMSRTPSDDHGSGGTAARIAERLAEQPLDGILQKRFYDG